MDNFNLDNFNLSLDSIYNKFELTKFVPIRDMVNLTDLQNRIEAEDADRFYDNTFQNLGGEYRQDGLDVEAIDNLDGGYNVGWIESGEHLAYDINVTTVGKYDLSLRIATDIFDTKEIQALLNGEDIGTVSFGRTGGWQSYTDVVISDILLLDTEQELRLEMLDSQFNIDYLELTLVEDLSDKYIRIEAEDADRFYDTTFQNLGGKYRQDGLDVEVSGYQDSGYNVGWIESGEHLAYDVDIATKGKYDLSLRVATDIFNTQEIQALLNGEDIGTVSFSHTGGWQSYTDVVISDILLESGEQELRLEMLDSQFNIDYLELNLVEDLSNMPIHIEAEDADRFYDLNSQNLGGEYRQDGLDVEASGNTDGGYNVGWIEQGEYLEYDLDIVDAGEYDILLRVATDIFDTKEIEISINDSSVGKASFNRTGGWQSYTDVIVSGISLESGSNELRLDMLDAQFNLDYLELLPSTESVEYI